MSHNHKFSVQTAIVTLKNKILYENKPPSMAVMRVLADAFEEIQKEMIELEQGQSKVTVEKRARKVASILGYNLRHGHKHPKRIKQIDSAMLAHSKGLKDSENKTDIRGQISEETASSIAATNRNIKNGEPFRSTYEVIHQFTKDNKEN